MLRIPPDACVHEHLLLLSLRMLNLCTSLQVPSTRPAICVCRGGGPVSVLDQTSAQIRESVGRAVVTPLQVPEESRIRENAHSPPSLRHRGSERGLHFWMVYLCLKLLTAHNVIGCWKGCMQFFVSCSAALWVLACREAEAVLVLCHVHALVVSIEHYY